MCMSAFVFYMQKFVGKNDKKMVCFFKGIIVNKLFLTI